MWEVAIIGGLVGVMFLWTYLSFNLGQHAGEKEHVAVRLLLILMTFLMIDVTLWIAKMIADLNNSGVGELMEVVWIGYTWVFIFIVAYYIIMFALWAIRGLVSKKR